MLSTEFILILSALCFAITVPWPAHLSREGLESLAIQLPRMRDMAEQMGVPLSKEAFWGQIPNPPTGITQDFIDSLKAMEDSPEVEELRYILGKEGYQASNQRVQELLNAIRPECERIRKLMDHPDWHQMIADYHSGISIHVDFYAKSRWFAIVQGYFALQHAERGELLKALELIEFSYQIPARMLCGRTTTDCLVAGGIAGSSQSNLKRLLPYLSTIGEIREARRIAQNPMVGKPFEYVLGEAIDDIIRTSQLEYFDLQYTSWEDMPDFAHAMPCKTEKTAKKYMEEIRKLPVELIRDAYHCLTLKANLVLFHPDVRTMEFNEMESTLRMAILALFDSKELTPRSRDDFEKGSLFFYLKFMPDWQTIHCSMRVALAMMEVKAISGSYPSDINQLSDLDEETNEEIQNGRIYLDHGGIHVKTVNTFGGVVGPKGIPPILLP